MRVSIIVFPGTNREKDMSMAFEEVTGMKPRLVWHKERNIGNPDIIVLPGGFSFGDYLRCGAMAAHSPIMREVVYHAGKGTRIFGVCNGFQMLLETGLLPGALLRNKTLRFICRQVFLRCENRRTVFTDRIDVNHLMHIPVAHGDGNYFASNEIISELEDGQRIAFRYCDENGEITCSSNPNGSSANIAGIYNRHKNILGMMPHPEDAVLQHHGNTSGLKMFESIAQSLS
jgi:phosphoribosylformylglycinamidine synthase